MPCKTPTLGAAPQPPPPTPEPARACCANSSARPWSHTPGCGSSGGASIDPSSTSSRRKTSPVGTPVRSRQPRTACPSERPTDQKRASVASAGRRFPTAGRRRICAGGRGGGLAGSEGGSLQSQLPHDW